MCPDYSVGLECPILSATLHCSEYKDNALYTTVMGHLCFGQAQPNILTYLTSIPTNINLPSFDGGGGCTGERKTEDGKLSTSIDSYPPKSNMPVSILKLRRHTFSQS